MARGDRTTFGDLSRSDLMSRIHGKGNATTEIAFARLLRRNGITGWRRNTATIMGKPDFVWRGPRVAVFVDGCFWHGHGCRNLRARSNAAYWRDKIANNARRDRRVDRSLRAEGWKVLHFWECAIAKRPSSCFRRLTFALGRRQTLDIRSLSPKPADANCSGYST